MWQTTLQFTPVSTSIHPSVCPSINLSLSWWFGSLSHSHDSPCLLRCFKTVIYLVHVHICWVAWLLASFQECMDEGMHWCAAWMDAYTHGLIGCMGKDKKHIMISIYSVLVRAGDYMPCPKLVRRPYVWLHLLFQEGPTSGSTSQAPHLKHWTLDELNESCRWAHTKMQQHATTTLDEWQKQLMTLWKKHTM